MFAKKNAGKPYAGKPHVRIDEGERGTHGSSFSTLLDVNFFMSLMMASKGTSEFLEMTRWPNQPPST